MRHSWVFLNFSPANGSEGTRDAGRGTAVSDPVGPASSRMMLSLWGWWGYRCLGSRARAWPWGTRWGVEHPHPPKTGTPPSSWRPSVDGARCVLGRGTAHLPPELPGASLEVRLAEGLPRAGSRARPAIPERFWSLAGAQEVGCQLETVAKPRGGPDSPRPSRRGFRPARPHRESSPALSPVWLCDPGEPGLPARAGQCAFGKAPWV